MSHRPDCRCPGRIGEQTRPSDARKQDIIACHRRAAPYAIADIKAYRILFLSDDQKAIVECLGGGRVHDGRLSGEWADMNKLWHCRKCGKKQPAGEKWRYLVRSGYATCPVCDHAWKRTWRDWLLARLGVRST